MLENVPEVVQTGETLPNGVQSVKFMDDATLQEAVTLKTNLASNRDRHGPLPSWESSGMVLPKQNSLLQHQLNIIKKLSDDREMVLNADKTCLFIVNFTQNYQFKPLLQIPDSVSPVDIVLETKLLGYWLTRDMKPHKHVEYLLKICYKRLWAISKLKRAGVCNKDILHFFFVKIRSVLETNAPVFHLMLTQDDSDDIERVQKIVLKVVLDEKYVDYQTACESMEVESLETRRTKLCLKFALKCLKSEKFKDFFEVNSSKDCYQFRDTETFYIPFASTTRYQKSPKIYLTSLLNKHFKSNDH